MVVFPRDFRATVIELLNIAHNSVAETFKCMTSSKANDINYPSIPQKELWKTSNQFSDRRRWETCAFSHKEALVYIYFSINLKLISAWMMPHVWFAIEPYHYGMVLRPTD